MLRSLITQPVRFATRGVSIAVRGAQEAIELAGGVVGVVFGHRNGHQDAPSDTSPPVAPEAASSWPGGTSAPADPAERSTPTAERSTPTAERGTPTDTSADEPTATAAAPAPVSETIAGQAADPIATEPIHVSESPELVDEVADPGAEDGAGAQIRIAEPWDGYRSMKAADIIDRLASSSTEELATVELYELAGRNRKSVVEAAQRALKQATPPGQRQ